MWENVSHCFQYNELIVNLVKIVYHKPMQSIVYLQCLVFLLASELIALCETVICKNYVLLCLMQGTLPGILGRWHEVFIISPAFIFSVARMYLSLSPTATRAIWAVLHPSSITWKLTTLCWHVLLHPYKDC